jgi:lysophospholipase L1-like esterase
VMKEGESVMRDVFVLGDSISIHYGPYLQQELIPHFSYDRKRGAEEALKDLNQPVGANGGDSGMVLSYLEEQKAQGVKYDILVVNCGLHDVKTDPVKQAKQINVDTYADHLNKICDIAAAMANQMVWVRTTPLIDEVHNRLNSNFFRYHKDVIEYNTVADSIMQQNKVPIVDLYAFTLGLGSEVFCDHVHFKEEIRATQAAFISEQLNGVFNR